MKSALFSKSGLISYVYKYALPYMVVRICYSIHDILGLIAACLFISYLVWRAYKAFSRIHTNHGPLSEDAKAYNRACKCIKKGDRPGAIANFARAVTIPDCAAEIHYQYGLFLLEIGATKDALDRLEQAVVRGAENHEYRVKALAEDALQQHLSPTNAG
jgi:tetratricopeptide (TPR) repeat protein